jgi:pyruvate,water dikinase
VEDGGPTWTRFAHRHLADVLPEEGGAQMLLRGLPEIQPMFSEHAVQSLDWYHPVAAELPTVLSLSSAAVDRRVKLAEERAAAERRCRAALAGRPRLLESFGRLLEVSQRYAVIREEQAHEFTLAWPVLRACAARLGQHLADLGVIQQADDLYFCTRDQVTSALAGRTRRQIAGIGDRREMWQRQRQLAAPLTLGRPAPLIGDVIDRAVERAMAPQPPKGRWWGILRPLDAPPVQSVSCTGLRTSRPSPTAMCSSPTPPPPPGCRCWPAPPPW